MAKGLPSELDSRPQSRREWTGFLPSLLLPVMLVVAIIGGLLYWQSRGPSSPASSDYGTVALPAALNVTGESPQAVEGRAAPDFILETMSGELVRLSDLQGGPVLISFWAGWCPACRGNLPALVQGHDSGLTVIAINVQESEERAQAMIAEFDLPFTVAMDRTGGVSQTWSLGARGAILPASFFIDGDGVVRKAVHGTLDAASLDQGLRMVAGTD